MNKPNAWQRLMGLVFQHGTEEDQQAALQLASGQQDPIAIDPATGVHFLGTTQAQPLDRKAIVENDPDVVAMRQQLAALKADREAQAQAALEERFKAIQSKGLFTVADAPKHREMFGKAPDVYEFAMAMAKPLPQFTPKSRTVDAGKVADELASSLPHGEELDLDAVRAEAREWAAAQNGGK